MNILGEEFHAVCKMLLSLFSKTENVDLPNIYGYIDCDAVLWFFTYLLLYLVL